jgi:hypothetical protein
MVVVCSVSTRLGLASVKRKNQQTKQLKTTHELWFQVQDDRQRSVASMLVLGNNWILFTFSRRKINMQRVPRKQDGALSRTGRAVRSTSLGLDSDLGKRWLSEVGSS